MLLRGATTVNNCRFLGRARVFRRVLSYDIDMESYTKAGNHQLKIDWNDPGSAAFEETYYDYAWLRDNCNCSHCVDPSSGQKIFNREHVTKVFPQTVKSNSVRNQITIEWNDDHKTIFSPDWLHKHSLMPDARNKRIQMQKPSLWTGETLSQVQSVRYEDVMKGNGGLLRWLEALQTQGICLITNGSQEETAVKKLAERVAPIRETSYGNTWKVESVPGAENIAYTNQRLELHSDILYYETPPGVQLLHCIKQAKIGGENFFADGFQIAEDFRREHPQFFLTLSASPITYLKEHHDTFRKYRRPMFQVDADNNIISVNFSPMFEGPLDLPISLVRPFYNAYTEWHAFVKKEKYNKELKLNEGEIITFNNRRVFHGRNSFPSTEGRLLVGTYLDLDDMANRLRVLKRDLGELFTLKRLGNQSY